MDQSIIPAICQQIEANIGITLSGSEKAGDARKGVSFWFSNYNRGNAPVFSIRPKGLKRHLVYVKFGPYAGDLIGHIANHATDESCAYCSNTLEELSSKYKVTSNIPLKISRKEIRQDLMIEIEKEAINPQSIESITETVQSTMIPLIACFSELIGYTENEEDLPDNLSAEGKRVDAHLSRLERNPRNRFLCLAIHGHKCGICGFDPVIRYGKSFKTIIEVHHIEPLSEISAPKIYNPRDDLIPLCPNCHRAIHKRTPAYTPDELRSKLLCLKTG